MKRTFPISLLLVSALWTLLNASAQAVVRVGVAKVDVTPKHPVVLAGYGGRTTEHEGVDTKLWARALVIGDQRPVAIVVLDNCGVPAAIKQRVVDRLAAHDMTMDRLVVAATHTHNAPSLVGYATILWAGRMTTDQERHMAAYTDFAVAKMAAAVEQALKTRQPMTLHWAQGRVGFGGNRRVLSGGKWAGFGWQRRQPVDHSLPVLAARDAAGKVRAIWANYACHCTTVGGRNQIGGDWAGYANDAMELAFPEAVALMTIGCGADIGPQPSGTLEIAQQHGRRIADEAARLLAGTTTQLDQPPQVKSNVIGLPLESPGDRDHWERERKRGGFHEQLARSMMARLDRDGSIPDRVDYPIVVWSFGDQLTMVFLAGEVVVDYAVRLNQEFDWSRLWITAWANDMPGYIPSRRILIEGGYEADFSQVYYDQPGRYTLDVENVLVSAIKALVDPIFGPRGDQSPAPFHQPPSMEKQAYARVAEWAGRSTSAEHVELLNWLRKHVSQAQPAIAAPSAVHSPQGGQDTDWHNFAGDFVERIFIRQKSRNAKLTWNAPVPNESKFDSLTLGFVGGVGWISEPQTAGFLLSIDGKPCLTFDVTLEPARWKSDDQSVELVYLPTWTSNVDSGGFFFLHFRKAASLTSDRIKLQVDSLGENSQRWFAIDRRQNFSARQRQLFDALQAK